MVKPASSEIELVLVAEEGMRVFQVPPGGTVTIGRDPENDVQADDRAVSRRHAIIHIGPPLEIEDLGGPNGTLVRPAATHAGVSQTVTVRTVRKRRTALAVGDVLLLGGAMLSVRRTAPALSTAGPGALVLDPAMKQLFEQAARAAQAMVSVLILGETGAGKEVLARAVHQASPRAKGPFLALNCAALAESLLESELFGHEKGSFTGAIQARAGLFESANGGTVFLDELGELPLGTQAKLLRVLEQREVLRVGARTARPVDVRFVAATNKDLEAACEKGSFRHDLYFRLAAFVLAIPPLRQRTVEIPELARMFLASACRAMDRAIPPTLSPATLQCLSRYPWPGNVRELKNLMERVAVLADAGDVLPEHLPARMTAPPSATPSPPRSPAVGGGDAIATLRREVAASERARILDALARCDGNQTRAAELLGVSRRTLINWLEEHQIERPRKRTGDGAP